MPDAPRAIVGYRFTSGIVVGLLFAICAVLLAVYKLNKEMTLKMAGELAERRQASAILEANSAGTARRKPAGHP